MNYSFHIPIETIADLAEDRISEEVREATMAHISTCSNCCNSLLRFRELIILMKSDQAEHAPREAVISAINLFRPVLRTAPLKVPRIEAKLTFDSFAATPAFGMRSGFSSSRQLLYSTDNADLDLRLTIRNDECVIAGQVMRAGCTGGLVEISSATESREVGINQSCEFSFPPVPIGNYLLRVKMVDVELEIPELVLKA